MSYDGGVSFANIGTTATNASYTNLATALADDSTLYQVIVSGACSPSVTSAPAAQLTVYDGPTAAGSATPAVVCASSPATTLNGLPGGDYTAAIWSGAGTFAPNAATMNATYTPTAAEIAARQRYGDLDGQQPERALPVGERNCDDSDQSGGTSECRAEPDGLRKQRDHAFGRRLRWRGDQRELEWRRHFPAEHSSYK